MKLETEGLYISGMIHIFQYDLSFYLLEMSWKKIYKVALKCRIPLKKKKKKKATSLDLGKV